MKKKILFLMMAAAVMAAASCNQNKIDTQPVQVDITLTSDGSVYEEDGINVTLTSQSTSVAYDAETTAGVATFSVIPGLYTASVSYRTTVGLDLVIYNGSASVTVTAGGENSFELAMTSSQASQLIIKEIYIGGTPKDDGSGTYQNDKYVILYNNGSTAIDASDVCFAFTSPMNANSTSKYLVDGTLSYIAQGWQPAAYAFWWFDPSATVTIEPYSQIVVAINGAIDHTATYSQSVNLSNSQYYCMYDKESGFNNASSYPAPDAGISSSHYLKTYRYGLGNAWPISSNSPGFFIFECDAPSVLAKNPQDYDLTDGEKLPNVKVPADAIVDAVDIFRAGYETNANRFPSSIDAGSIVFTNQQGYSVYRNVDKEATEALPENEGLLVYNYTGGTVGLVETSGTTDPSGIDAEASIAAGAHIIYMDTNNSTNDFHMRAKASLRK